MIDYTEVDENTRCGNCKHKTTHIAGITYEVCKVHCNTRGRDLTPFMIPDDDWFCAEFEPIEEE